MNSLVRLLIPAVIVAAAVLFSPTVPARAQEELCFPETGQCISGRFREYWEQNGGLPVFGYPITSARDEFNRDTGQTYRTQWFERNRFELHPENPRPYDVLLGRLGDDRLIQQGRVWHAFPKATPGLPHYFAETGHAIAEVFWNYWSRHGLEFGDPGVSRRESLALFGFPISEAMMETNASGDTVLTQWFERARFEYHPGNPDPYKVLLGLLGNETRAQENNSSVGGDPCGTIPAAVSGRVLPSNCVVNGEIPAIEFSGFQPHEKIGFWVTSPDGAIYGTVQTFPVDANGVLRRPFDTNGLPPGLWSWAAEGTESGHKAVVYVKLVKLDELSITCDPVPDPQNAVFRPGKCIRRGGYVFLQIFGFKPREMVSYWLTTPEGEIHGATQKFEIGPDGNTTLPPLSTIDLWTGLWQIVFKGNQSGQEAVIYFRIVE